MLWKRIDALTITLKRNFLLDASAVVDLLEVGCVDEVSE